MGENRAELLRLALAEGAGSGVLVFSRCSPTRFGVMGLPSLKNFHQTLNNIIAQNGTNLIQWGTGTGNILKQHMRGTGTCAATFLWVAELEICQADPSCYLQ
jgi:hypothetical protein